MRIALLPFAILLQIILLKAQIPLIPISGADGRFEMVTVNGVPVYRNVPNGNQGFDPYLYLYTNSTVKNVTAYVEIQYLDIGIGKISLDYNSATNAYEQALDGFERYLQNSGKVRTAVFQLPNADFRNAQNLGADLRLYTDPDKPKHLVKATLYFTAPPLWKEYDLVVTGPYTGKKYNRTDKADATTLKGKMICGYQGWFRTPGDVESEGWVHYSRDQEFRQVSVDLWPEMEEYTQAEKYPVPGWTLKNGNPAVVFSSANQRTVLRHFQWMQAYGIDGAAIQRFVVGLEPGASKNKYRIPIYAREAANKTGRVFYLMYDQSGTSNADLVQRIRDDWKYMVDSLQITKDERYLHHDGLPVVSMFGFYPERFPAALAHQVLDIFEQPGYQAKVIGSGEIFWRTPDQVPSWDTEWQKVYQRMAAYTPWNVGHYTGPDTIADLVSTHRWAGDKAEMHAAGKLYMPLVFPGFSWDNLMNHAPGTTKRPRQKGKLMWEQIKAARSLGVDAIYVAMFDEIDEGTAIFKLANNIPINDYFLTNENLPSDFYLCLTGYANEQFKKNQTPEQQVPAFELKSQPSIPDFLYPREDDTVGVQTALTWSPAIHHTGIARYQLDVDGVLQNVSTTGTQLQLAPGVHEVRVRAFNQLGNAGGWSQILQFIVDEKATSAVSGASGDWWISPNPASSTVWVQWANPWNEKVRLTLRNANGHLLAAPLIDLETGNGFEMDVQSLAPGYYWISVQSAQGVQSKKLLVLPNSW